MKCPSCGGETTGAFCPYCGSEMPRQPINITNNYYGYPPNTSVQNNEPASTIHCTQCGGTKISFNRESVGTRGMHRTVGLCKNCGYTWVTSQDVMTSSKDRIIALILCISLGYFGAHQFYVGKKGVGWLYVFTIGLFGVGWIYDIICLCKGTFKDANGYTLK